MLQTIEVEIDAQGVAASVPAVGRAAGVVDAGDTRKGIGTDRLAQFHWGIKRLAMLQR